MPLTVNIKSLLRCMNKKLFSPWQDSIAIPIGCTYICVANKINAKWYELLQEQIEWFSYKYDVYDILLNTFLIHVIRLWISTVKHIYSDHAYNEMTLITKHLGIPGKHSIYFFIDFTLKAKLHITKSGL